MATLLLTVAPFVAVAIAATSIIRAVEGTGRRVHHELRCDLMALQARVEALAEAVEALGDGPDCDDEPDE